jgi:hypothetical protein
MRSHLSSRGQQGSPRQCWGLDQLTGVTDDNLKLRHNVSSKSKPCATVQKKNRHAIRATKLLNLNAMRGLAG